MVVLSAGLVRQHSAVDSLREGVELYRDWNLARGTLLQNMDYSRFVAVGR
jgi:hypothetical protein